jgi:hypothetical protein
VVQADDVIELIALNLVSKLMGVAFIAFDGNNVSVIVKPRQKVSKHERPALQRTAVGIL